MTRVLRTNATRVPLLSVTRALTPVYGSPARVRPQSGQSMSSYAELPGRADLQRRRRRGWIRVPQLRFAPTGALASL